MIATYKDVKEIVEDESLDRHVRDVVHSIRRRIARSFEKDGLKSISMEEYKKKVGAEGRVWPENAGLLKIETEKHVMCEAELIGQEGDLFAEAFEKDIESLKAQIKKDRVELITEPRVWFKKEADLLMWKLWVYTKLEGVPRG